MRMHKKIHEGNSQGTFADMAYHQGSEMITRSDPCLSMFPPVLDLQEESVLDSDKGN